MPASGVSGADTENARRPVNLSILLDAAASQKLLEQAWQAGFPQPQIWSPEFPGDKLYCLALIVRGHAGGMPNPGSFWALIASRKLLLSAAGLAGRAFDALLSAARRRLDLQRAGPGKLPEGAGCEGLVDTAAALLRDR